MSIDSLQSTSRQYLLELQEPLLLKDILYSTKGFNDWKLADWSLEEFAIKTGSLKLPFRVGKNIRTSQPQWETETPIEYKTMKEFLDEAIKNSNPSKWFYFDYKHMNEWFMEIPDIVNSFNWKQFGVDLNGSDSTMWIGSQGAHTNCHQDTYGCNLVAQIHGRKLWLLFSPECSDKMQPTRIPYEESTVYSKYNFFAPNKTEIEAIKCMSGSVKMIILEPKDVLFIPKGWWHYVESLDTSLSVNIWIPLKEDCESRLKETLVHLIVNTIGAKFPKANQPNSNLEESIKFIENSIQECQEIEKISEPLVKKRKLSPSDTNVLDTLKMKYPDSIKIISNLTSENIKNFIEKNNLADINTNLVQNTGINEPSRLTLHKAVVNAFCNPSIISKISQILTDEFINKPFKKVDD